MGFFDGGGLAGLDRFTAFQRRRELRRLRRTLWKGEQVVRVLDGQAEGCPGILALTSDRLLWVPGRRFGPKSVLPLREVQALRVAAGEQGGVLTLETDRLALVVHASGDESVAFAGEARSLARDQGNTHLRVGTTDDRPVREVDAVPDEVLEAKLKRLARMHERGSMTTEEYRIARDQLLKTGPGQERPEPPQGTWWRRF